jgi:hypothetical protein
MFDYVAFFYNRTPGRCWGSQKNVWDWTKARGMFPPTQVGRTERPASG